jgi:predicted porin
MNTMTNLSTTMIFLLSSSVVSANDSGIEFYGKFDVSLQNSDSYNQAIQETDHITYTKSNGSRMGLRIAQPLDNGLRVFIQLESAVDFNTDNAYDVHFLNRNTYIGVGSEWGELLVGQNDSPLKISQGNIDVFSDSDSQMWPLQRGENRVSDVIQYNSSSFGAFKVSAAVANNPGTAQNNYGYSATLKYDFNGIYTAIAIDRDILDYDVLRWVGSYSNDLFTLSALVQRSESTRMGKSKKGYTLSLLYPLYDYMLKFQYTNSDEIIPGGEFMTVGIDWRYSDSILLYTFYTDRNADEKAGEGYLLSVGMKYQF